MLLCTAKAQKASSNK